MDVVVDMYVARLRQLAAGLAVDDPARFYLFMEDDILYSWEAVLCEGENASAFHDALLGLYAEWARAMGPDAWGRVLEYNEGLNGANQNGLLHDMAGMDLFGGGDGGAATGGDGARRFYDALRGLRGDDVMFGDMVARTLQHAMTDHQIAGGDYSAAHADGLTAVGVLYGSVVRVLVQLHGDGSADVDVLSRGAGPIETFILDWALVAEGDVDTLRSAARWLSGRLDHGGVAQQALWDVVRAVEDDEMLRGAVLDGAAQGLAELWDVPMWERVRLYLAYGAVGGSALYGSESTAGVERGRYETWVADGGGVVCDQCGATVGVELMFPVAFDGGLDEGAVCGSCYGELGLADRVRR